MRKKDGGRTYGFLVAGDEEVLSVLDGNGGKLVQRSLSFRRLHTDIVEEV